MTEDLTMKEQDAIHVAFALCGATGNLSPLLAAVDDIVTARETDAAAKVANAFVAWASKNEIAPPPLDWAWFGEIARRYSPLHEEHNAEETP